MIVATLDFETYFDQDYTLKKMTTEAYVRDPRFEAHGAAVTIGEQAAWLRPSQLNWLLNYWKTTGAKVALIAHHAHFDGLILNHHFDFCPDLWVCTLSMGRVLFSSGLKLSLDHLSRYFGLTPKTIPYHLFKGLHWDQMPAELQQAVASGAIHDCHLTQTVANYMLCGGHPAVPYPFPQSEIEVVDITVRMFTEPTLIGDIDALADVWRNEERERQELFARLGVTGQELRKDDVFAEMLDELGVELTSPDKYALMQDPENAQGIKTTAKGNVKYAFAKSDYFMQNLALDEDPDVALLAEARLRAQSSIYQTRAERLGWKATRGPLPVYLAYAVAHTRRWGGGDKDNWQNFPRPDPAKPQKGALRRAIKAP